MFIKGHAFGIKEKSHRVLSTWQRAASRALSQSHAIHLVTLQDELAQERKLSQAIYRKKVPQLFQPGSFPLVGMYSGKKDSTEHEPLNAKQDSQDMWEESLVQEQEIKKLERAHEREMMELGGLHDTVIGYPET